MSKPYVFAMRLYWEGPSPMADLAVMKDGEITEVIEGVEWDRCSERDKYFVNSYTFVVDERTRGESFDQIVENWNIH